MALGIAVILVSSEVVGVVVRLLPVLLLPWVA